MKLPKVHGVTVERAEAVWVTCDLCEEQELIFGMGLDAQVRIWVEQHYAEDHSQ